MVLQIGTRQSSCLGSITYYEHPAFGQIAGAFQNLSNHFKNSSSSIPRAQVGMLIEAATCEGGGFFLFSSWDPPRCGAIPKHSATRSILDGGRTQATAPTETGRQSSHGTRFP